MLPLVAALALASTLAHGADARDTGRRGQPGASSGTQCQMAGHAVLTTREGSVVLGSAGVTGAGPDWLDRRAGLSEHAYTVLHNSGQGDIDGLNGPCKLDDADKDKESRTNDGVDVAKVLKDVDEWLELNRKWKKKENDAEFPQNEKKVRLEVGSDNRLHAYVGEGVGKTDVARLTERRWEMYDVEAGAGFHQRQSYASLDATFQAQLESIEGQRYSLGGHSLMAAVPEPSTYLMWIGGLAAMAYAMRRKRAAS